MSKREELGIIRNPRIGKANGRVGLYFEIELLLGAVGSFIGWIEAEGILASVEKIEDLHGHGCVVEADDDTAKFKKLK